MSEPKRLSLREAKKAACRRQILRAARYNFEEQGYYATTVNEIARTAGISVASLFNYFPTKLSLMEALEQMKLGDFSEILQKYLPSSPTNLQKLLLVFDSYIEDIYRYPRLSFQISEFHAFGVLPGSSNMEVHRQVSDLIEQAIQAGELRPGVMPDTLQTIFFALAFSTFNQGKSRNACFDNFAQVLRLLASDPDAVPNREQLLSMGQPE